MRDYYKVLLVSQSGKGKTYSFKNMNPETTGFVNVENKPLPFKNNFKFHARPLNTAQVKTALKEFADNPVIECIVFDSLSAYLDMLLAEARATKKGFDVWNQYNEEVGKFFNYLKSIQKEVFITAHYEWIQDEGGAKERRTKVKGKEWEGVIEKEFSVVLYVDNKFDGKTPTYQFNTIMENSSAKCPPDIFGSETSTIQNDCLVVLNAIKEFVK